MQIRRDEGIGYDDVLLVPKLGVLKKRREADLTQILYPFELKLPILSAPMSSVTETKMMRAMRNAGGLGILHRFQSVDEAAHQFNEATFEEAFDAVTPAAAAIGINEGDMRIKRLREVGCRMFVLDVAHAHHIAVGEWLKKFSYALSDAHLMVGNVATAEGARYLLEHGVDSIKVGIGPGAACTTRNVTGFGIPQLTAIMEVSEEVAGEVPVIADGGIRDSGDIVKALAAGADFVMLGRLLAGSDEAPFPGEYFGMASKRVNGHVAPEGVEGFVERTGPVSDTLEPLAGGIRSAISYAGATDIEGLRDNAEFIRVSDKSLAETGVRI